MIKKMKTSIGWEGVGNCHRCNSSYQQELRQSSDLAATHMFGNCSGKTQGFFVRQSATGTAGIVVMLSILLSWTVSIGLGQNQAGDTQSTSESDQDSPLEVGDDVLLILNNGDRLEGKWAGEQDNTIIITIAKVDLHMPRDDVERVIRLEPAMVRFERMRRLIEDDDVERRITLVHWLREHGLYATALKELDEILIRAPNDGDALRLKREVTQQYQLIQRRIEQPQTQPVDESTSNERSSESGRGKWGPFQLLTDDQVNLIKMYEVDLANPPRFQVPREVVEQLISEHSDDPLIPSTRQGREALFGKSPNEIVDLIFRVQARELYGKITVIGQPHSMELFREQVHSTWLMNSCATSRCHGSPGAGRLWLTNRGRNADRSVYTNFLILERFRFEDGEGLIDYDRPGRSALLQMGLLGADARRSHPLVAGWSPIFRSRTARRFRQAEQWIRSMYRPRPTYPIEYTPPGMDAQHSGHGVER